jgi:hypothetical protein
MKLFKIVVSPVNGLNQLPVRCCSGLSCAGVGGAVRNTSEDFDRFALLCRPCGEYGSSGVVRLMPAIASFTTKQGPVD